MAINSSPAEGMRDLLPKEVQLRNYVVQTILSVYNEFGFTQIETPCAENIKVLPGGTSSSSSIKIAPLVFKSLTT